MCPIVASKGVSLSKECLALSPDPTIAWLVTQSLLHVEEEEGEYCRVGCIVLISSTRSLEIADTSKLTADPLSTEVELLEEG